MRASLSGYDLGNRPLLSLEMNEDMRKILQKRVARAESETGLLFNKRTWAIKNFSKYCVKAGVREIRMTAARKSVSKSEKHDAQAEGVSRLSEHNPYWSSSLSNEVYLRSDVTRKHAQT